MSMSLKSRSAFRKRWHSGREFLAVPAAFDCCENRSFSSLVDELTKTVVVTHLHHQPESANTHRSPRPSAEKIASSAQYPFR